MAVPGCRKPQNGPSVVRARGAGRPCVARRGDGGKPREGEGAVVATQARLLSRRLVRVNYTPNGGGSLRCRPFARPRRPVEAARQRPLSLSLFLFPRPPTATLFSFSARHLENNRKRTRRRQLAFTPGQRQRGPRRCLQLITCAPRRTAKASPTPSLTHSALPLSLSPLSRNDSHSFRGDCRYALLGRFTDLLRSGSETSENFFLVA